MKLRCLISADTALNAVKVKPTSNIYGYFLNDKKLKEFGVLDTIDVREDIQAALPTCDYTLIMKALNPSRIDFNDFDDVIELAGAIDDPIDAVGLVDVLAEQFKQLPLEVKEHYGNDYAVFAHDLIRGGFADFVAEKYGTEQGSQSIADSGFASDNGVEKSDAGRTKTAGRNDVDLDVLRRQLDEVKQKLDGTGKEGE